MTRLVLLGALSAVAFGAAYGLATFMGRAPQQPPPGMRWIPGGEFTMGSDDPDVDEINRHRVGVGVAQRVGAGVEARHHDRLGSLRDDDVPIGLSSPGEKECADTDG